MDSRREERKGKRFNTENTEREGRRARRKKEGGASPAPTKLDADFCQATVIELLR